MNLKEKLRGIKVAKPGATPLWAGPSGEGRNGGVTFSLLGKFLACRARFKVQAVDGLKPHQTFSHKAEYGQMWHTCEEHYAAGNGWQAALATFTAALTKQYPLEGAQVSKWSAVCRQAFPVYLNYWQGEEKRNKVAHLYQEKVFDLPYRLPSGRVVRLRGKMDGVDLLEKDPPGTYLFETKTKGNVDEGLLQRQLLFDLQTMLYLVVLDTWQELPHKLRGVRYNCIRRPLSGGKGTITQRKPTRGSKCGKCKGNGYGPAGIPRTCPKCRGQGRTGGKPGETATAYYDRLGGIIAASPSDYFYRWHVAVTPLDLQRFKDTFLNPVLEQMAWWYDTVVLGKTVPLPAYAATWRLPYGVRSYVDEAGDLDVAEHLTSGSTVGLRRVDTLFPELEV